MSSPIDPPIRRPSAPTPGPRDGDPDPLTPEESAEVVGELLRGLRAEVGAVGREVAELRGAVSTLATHGTPSQRVAADQEQTARLGITAQQVVSAARWQAVQTLLADQAVRAGIVAGCSVLVVVSAALIWYLVTGETRPPIPGVSP